MIPFPVTQNHLDLFLINTFTFTNSDPTFCSPLVLQFFLTIGCDNVARHDFCFRLLRNFRLLFGNLAKLDETKRAYSFHKYHSYQQRKS